MWFRIWREITFFLEAPMGIARRYIKKVHEETTFYATWTPSQVLSLGDYGVLDDDGVFVFQGNVKDLGFSAISVNPSTRPDDFLEITTAEGTSINVKLSGQGLPGSKLPDSSAGVVFSLTRSDSLICKLKGPKQESIGNFKALQDFVIQQYTEGKWTKDWRIVNQRVVADGTTIIYSDTDGVEIQASANAPVKNIADPSLQFGLVFKKGGSVSVLGGADLTPFVSLVRLQAPLFGTPRVSSLTPGMVISGQVSPVLIVESPK